MDKPLPEIPQLIAGRTNAHTAANVPWAQLTVDGRNHLRKFILYCLDEAHDVIPAPERETWVDNVESALGELGERVFMGGWLPGLRRARRRRAAEHERQRIKQLDEERKHAEDGEVATKKDGSYDSELKAEENATLRPSSSPKESLAALRVVAGKPTPPTLKLTAKHLLLTVSSLQPATGSAVETDCKFTAGTFALPADDTTESHGTHGDILYGLDNWAQLSTAEQSDIQLVGGTFSFAGVSDAQYEALVKVLRLSVFTYLSIILEQSLLADSHVALRYPKRAVLVPTPDSGAGIARALSTGNVGHKAAPAKRESGLWAFFSKKKEDLRAVVPSSLARRGSLELPAAITRSRSKSPTRAGRSTSRHGEDIRKSADMPTRPRRFSFISDYKPLFLQAAPAQSHEEHEEDSVERPLSLALTAVEKGKRYLSTSPDILFPAPGVLAKLAGREKSDEHQVKLGGDEKAALGSLLGWDNKQARTGSAGAGMVGTAGFVRQQALSVLYTEYVPRASSRPPTPSSSSEQAPLVLCGQRRRWVTFRFYSQPDECLGETLLRMCARADEPCDNPDCRSKRGEHELRLTHADTRITIVTSATDSEADVGDDEVPEMWESCRVCNKETSKQRMHDGTYLLSFAKYLELLVYSSSLCSISPAFCEHTSLPTGPRPASELPPPHPRLNIIRHFSHSGHAISISLSNVEYIYEIRVPRLRIIRPRLEKQEDPDIKTEAFSSAPNRMVAEVDRRTLRREIMQFWQSLSEQMDTLEGNFINEHAEKTYHKSLPRLPSADEAYDSFDEDGLATPKGHPVDLPPLPPNTPMTPKTHSSVQSYPFPAKSDAPESANHEADFASGSDAASTSESTSLQLLTSMRHTFQRTEQSLYAHLSRVPLAELNDVRRQFVSAGRGATKRLSAWEAKHASGPPTVTEATAQSEPEWWKAGCHAVPGGNVIVRENDWGSIIAFTLSSTDYHRELTNMTANRMSTASPAPPPTPEVTRSSFFTKSTPSRWFSPSGPTPDPDQEGVVWHEPETYSAVISRKEHPRDTASMLKLGITEVLRQKNLPDPGAGSGSSKIGNGSGMGSKGLVPSAWAKPDVQVSKEAVDGQLSASSNVEGVDKILQELEAAEPPRSLRSSWSENSHPSSSSFVETNIRRGKTSSIVSKDSDATTVGEHTHSSHQAELPVPPPKDTVKKDHEIEASMSASTSHSIPPTEPQTPSAGPGQPSMTSTFTNSLTSALRYMLKSGLPPPVPSKHHHGLLLAGSPAIDDRPHIKYDWTIGKRLKFSCTVYYAKQFEALRRRCGIGDTFLHSLARSENWSAEGGKSRSNFWKTTDNQFIIKTLVNAWNVADLHVLIELGPSYFRHMDATANKPTVLAKLLGFYTVEVRNLETGNVQAKADLLVMENLFYNQTIVKTFDLKGIQGRKVKAASSSSGSKTLFDGDWIEGQQRALTLVQPHSKVVLQEAIRADSDFLARSNIMDYSLLLGIDEDHREIACGLVDTIGSYTFAKTLEYKAKHNLSSGKEVTVIPPHEYQERFVHAMDNYFVACPDKWSRPMDNTKLPSDYWLLPSVL